MIPAIRTVTVAPTRGAIPATLEWQGYGIWKCTLTCGTTGFGHGQAAAYANALARKEKARG